MGVEQSYISEVYLTPNERVEVCIRCQRNSSLPGFLIGVYAGRRVA